MKTISGLDKEFRRERKLQLEMKYKSMQRDNEGILLFIKAYIESQILHSQRAKVTDPKSIIEFQNQLEVETNVAEEDGT
jgi:hypothetical protein